jgi:excisionase family DNA binding protein
MKELLSVREVANELGYSGATIRRWIGEGKVNHIRIFSKGIRVHRDEIRRLLEIGRQPVGLSNQPTANPTALATTGPASSGTSKSN